MGVGGESNVGRTKTVLPNHLPHNSMVVSNIWVLSKTTHRVCALQEINTNLIVIVLQKIMSTPILFVIVGKNEPLFEAEIDTTSGAAGGNDLSTRQNYFVLHSSLDLVEKSSWTTNNMYLRVVDKVREST